MKTAVWISSIEKSVIKMTAIPFSSLSLQMAQDYFSHLNPLAQRFASDINTIKSTYGQLWYTLKANQRNEIINESLIKPEFCLKYLGKPSSSASSLSSNSSSASLSRTSILQSSKRREQNYSPNANDSINPNSLADNIIKQTQNLFSISLVSHAKHTVQSLGKLKPPSSPPPPPPITTEKCTKTENAEKHTELGLLETLRCDHSKTSNETTNYFYDGTNLNTYTAQKVALKIIYDDELGAYRDEHSQPFSYHTQSQIDLQQQYYEADLDDINLVTNSDNIRLTSNERSKGNLVENVTLTKNYEQLQKELKSTLNNHLETSRKRTSSDISIANNVCYKSGYDINSKASTNNYGVNKCQLPVSEEVSKIQSAKQIQSLSLRNLNKCENKSSKYLRQNVEKHTSEGSLLDFTPKELNTNNAVYTEVYFEQGESVTLLHNYRSSGILTESSNMSTNTTDEDEHNNYEYDDEDDEKTLCEDIRLLENDLDLRRGFDFLNNW